MFSRVGRLTTFGAQAVSNCPFRRDNIYQQPLKVTAPINDQIVNFAHNFSDSLRPRTTSFGNDPFFGVAMDDEEVIKELELLDLDSWHTKPRAPCPAPSDSLDVDQFWDGKNATLEAWRSTDTWQTHGEFPQFFGEHTTRLEPDQKKAGRIEELKVPKFEMDVESASKAVDWEAWNQYLESDDDVKRPESFFTTPEAPNAFKMSATAPRLLNNHHHHDIDLFSSGPLVYVPKREEPVEEDVHLQEDNDDDDEDYLPTARRARKSTAFRRRSDSEHSWTPAAEDVTPPVEEKTSKFKKRGVVLKPHVDEETDRRRALNRIAAVRYREKKRAEKMGRKREFDDVIDRNRILVQKERQLKREINALKKELRKLGAIV